MEEVAEIKALLKVWLKVLFSLAYTYYIVSKLPNSKLRFFSLIPIFYVFTILPLSLSTPTTAGLTGFFVTWLANFRLLLFSFDVGPLTHDLPRRSFFAFILLAALPIKIKEGGNYPFAQTKKLTLSLWAKALIYVFLLVAAILGNVTNIVNHNIILGIYCCIIYFSLEVILGLYNKVVSYILGVELCQPFDEPYLSTSLQDFWGRRWNLMVSDVLRHTIYLPVRSFSEFYIGRWSAQILATMAAFAVSGLMHELLFYYLTHANPTWEVTCFFLLHGACLLVEMGLKRDLGLEKKWNLHWALTCPLTAGFVFVTVFWLFLPQLVRNGVDKQSLEEVKAVGRFLEGVSGWDILVPKLRFLGMKFVL